MNVRYSTALGAILGLLVLGCESTTNPTEVRLSQQGGDAFLLTPANAEILHTYRNSLGHEVTSLIPVNASKLLPLLPAGYGIVPAAILGIGGESDGVVVLANFRGFDQAVDATNPGKQEYVGIWVAILVAEPAEAVEAGVSIPGAFHLYALAAYVNSAQVFASLQAADMPVELVNRIDYQRGMDDASGVGDLIVRVPAKDAPFFSFNHSEQGYFPAPGSLDAVFWNDGRKGKAALHYHGEPFRLGNAISQIYTDPQSTLGILIDGGGWGPCPPDTSTGYGCVIAPSFNLRYDQGSVGTLWLIE